MRIEANKIKTIKTNDLISINIKDLEIDDIIQLDIFKGIDEDVNINLDTFIGLDKKELANELYLNFYSSNYSFDKFKTNKNKKYEITFTSVEEINLDKAIIVNQAITNTKEIINTPHNYFGTNEYVSYITKLVESLNSKKVSLNILGKKEIEELGMNALLAVNKGSKEEAKFVCLKYQNSKKDPICLIGKGIMFDSGGYSLKPSDSMKTMKKDMTGSATVLGVFEAAVKLKVDVNLVVLLPLTDNMISSEAFTVDDIVYAMNKKSIEIFSTDAEGRLILADALCYANYIGCNKIIDIATLTGGIGIALGTSFSGLFSNSKELASDILIASKIAKEGMWELPITNEAKKMVRDSKVADLRNSTGRYASSICAAAFLEEFVDEKTKWAHIDIAATAMKNELATAVCLRTLLEYVINF